MAKDKTVNKSSHIRDLLAQNPNTSVKEIVETLAKKGVTVTPNLVYLIKAKAKARKRRRVRQQVAQVVANGKLDPVLLVRKVKALAAEVGGLGKLKGLLEALQD
jgi:hypothetical protein